MIFTLLVSISIEGKANCREKSKISQIAFVDSCPQNVEGIGSLQLMTYSFTYLKTQLVCFVSIITSAFIRNVEYYVPQSIPVKFRQGLKHILIMKHRGKLNTDSFTAYFEHKIFFDTLDLQGLINFRHYLVTEPGSEPKRPKHSQRIIQEGSHWL